MEKPFTLKGTRPNRTRINILEWGAIYRVPLKVLFLEKTESVIRRLSERQNCPIPERKIQLILGEFMICKTPEKMEALENRTWFGKIEEPPGSLIKTDKINTWMEIQRFANAVYPDFCYELRKETGDFEIDPLDKVILENPKLGVLELADRCRAEGIPKEEAKDARVQKRRERLIKLYQECCADDLRDAVYSAFQSNRTCTIICHVLFNDRPVITMRTPEEVEALFTPEAWKKYPVGIRDVYGTKIFTLVANHEPTQTVTLNPWTFDYPQGKLPTWSEFKRISQFIALRPLGIRQNEPESVA